MPKEIKTTLTPEETLEVAYWHIVKGYPQHDLAAMFGVNPGRVAEACKALRYTSENIKDVYKLAGA